MKNQALVLCAILAFGACVVSTAQQAAGGALGNATTDETALVIADQDAGAGNPGTAVAAPNGIMYFLRMLLVLAFVLGAMYLVFRLLRGLSRPKPREDETIRVLSSASLGPGRALHVVSLGDKAWLLGASDGSVSLLAPVEDRELLDALLLKASQESSAPRADFAALLGELLGKRGRSRSAAKPAGTGRREGVAGLPGSYLSRQRERLRKYREPGP